MPLTAETAAALVPLLPLAAFAFLGLGVRRYRKTAALISVVAIAASFALALSLLVRVAQEGVVSASLTWLRVGEVAWTVGLRVDPLAALMLVLVTSVSLAVQVYSLEYMKGEPRFGWYFAAHSLFAASMLGLVLTDSLLLLYISWELVGLCSFLLIGFWFEHRPAAEAAKKAFVTTRIGDVGLLIGVLVLFTQTGSFAMDDAFAWAQSPGVSEAFLTVVVLLIFLGAMGKSAQVPFHVWLPDAMEGPTPVSALIHAATMVTAGVFLVARLFPLFLEAPVALGFVAVIGAITTLLAGAMALAAVDFKRVLAYSTVSQLGLMMLALGAAGLAGEHEPVSGIFHLVTHGFFKALLFLTAGVALHAIGKHAATMEGVRGLGGKAPFATLSLAVGALALAGVPPLSGFFSKEEVLAAPLSVGGALGVALFLAALTASFLSSLYMARLFFVVVPGKPGPEGQHLHDPPPAMSLPMTVLLLLSIAVGLPLALGIGLGLPLGSGIGPFLGGKEYHLDPVLALVGTAVGLAGIVVGWALYYRRSPSVEKVAAYLGPLPRWAREGFFFDRAYQAAIDRVALVAARFLMTFDRRVVNDMGVDGAGKTAVVTGRVLRPVQTGKAYNYALAIVAGLVLLTVVTLLLR